MTRRNHAKNYITTNVLLCRGGIMIYIILSIAIALNFKNKEALLLTLLIFLSYFLPVEYIHNYYTWWSMVVGTEIFIIISALVLTSELSLPIVFVYAMLTATHINAIMYNYYKNSYYKMTVVFLEYLALATCIVFSDTILIKIKEFVKCLLKR